MSQSFPVGFLWGVSTAAHQIEGNQHNNWSVWEQDNAERLARLASDWYKPSVPDWPAVEAQICDPANYVSGAACNHYQLFRQDIALARSLGGLNAFRISIEWSRIEPEPGRFDTAEIAHYQQVIDALRSDGFEPFIVLHHFTNPIWFDELGWHHRRAPYYFKRFAQRLADDLSGVKFWVTVNEPISYVLSRYLGGGIWPAWPKEEFSPWRAHKSVRNFAEAHRLVYELLHKVDDSAKVGMTHGIPNIVNNSGLLGRAVKWIADYYPNRYLLQKLQRHQDFIGAQYYVQLSVKVGLNNPQNWMQHDTTELVTDIGWAAEPRGIYDVTQYLKRYKLPIYILENGVDDRHDKFRAPFIHDTLQAVHDSIADGADIRGYFHWSLMDNFEWSTGWWPKLGLASVNRDGGEFERSLRDSAYYYGRLATANALLPTED